MCLFTFVFYLKLTSLFGVYFCFIRTISVSVILSIMLQELVTLTIAAEVSGDHMNAVNVVGLIICMTGISVHVISKSLNGNFIAIPVNKRRLFDVDTTLFVGQLRCYSVETTSCADWVNAHNILIMN